MGASTDAILAYGYDLGCDDLWHVTGLDEDGDWRPSWLGEDEELPAGIERTLLASVGFDETDWRAPDFYSRKWEAEGRLGVKLVRHCCDEYPMYVLAAHQINAARGDVEALDLAELDAQRVERAWDDKLAAALSALGITPTQVAPSWLLVSWWG